MLKFKFGISIVFASALLFAALGLSCNSSKFSIHEFKSLNSQARIEPDYSDAVIPPNIAPLNFIVKEKAERYLVKIYGDSGRPVLIQSKNATIEIPPISWERLLNNNREKSIHIEIYTYDSVIKWSKYQETSFQVALQPIDRYLVYRYLRPNYTVQQEMTLRQRYLTTFSESVIMTTKTTASCVNCHSFRKNSPDNMLFHIRWGAAAGTILAQGGKIHKIDTRTEFNDSPGAYPSWHPNGKLAAFSVNKVFQFFHAAVESRDVIDTSSDIIIYKIEQNIVTTHPSLASPDFMETFPTWSPDGRYLYFCRAPRLSADFSIQEDFRNIKYDLLRIAYEPETETWGEPERLISARETNLSCSHPRISPDGKYLLFCLAAYGSFPIFNSASDLYMMTLADKNYHHLEINSDSPEGYHSWASNSHWIVFTSKRDNGVYTRLYFSYVDDQGKAHKPFILPQKNPNLNQGPFYSFSIPELIIKPVPFSARQFIAAALDPAKARKATFDPNLQMPASPQEKRQVGITDDP